MDFSEIVPQQMSISQQMSAPQQINAPQQMSISQQMSAPQQINAPQQMNVSQQMSAPQQMNAPQQMSAPQQMNVSQEISDPQISLRQESTLSNNPAIKYYRYLSHEDSKQPSSMESEKQVDQNTSEHSIEKSQDNHCHDTADSSYLQSYQNFINRQNQRRQQLQQEVEVKEQQRRIKRLQLINQQMQQNQQLQLQQLYEQEEQHQQEHQQQNEQHQQQMQQDCYKIDKEQEIHLSGSGSFGSKVEPQEAHRFSDAPLYSCISGIENIEESRAPPADSMPKAHGKVRFSAPSSDEKYTTQSATNLYSAAVQHPKGQVIEQPMLPRTYPVLPSHSPVLQPISPQQRLKHQQHPCALPKQQQKQQGPVVPEQDMLPKSPTQPPRQQQEEQPILPNKQPILLRQKCCVPKSTDVEILSQSDVVSCVYVSSDDDEDDIYRDMPSLIDMTLCDELCLTSSDPHMDVAMETVSPYDHSVTLTERYDMYLDDMDSQVKNDVPVSVETVQGFLDRTVDDHNVDGLIDIQIMNEQMDNILDENVIKKVHNILHHNLQVCSNTEATDNCNTEAVDQVNFAVGQVNAEIGKVDSGTAHVNSDIDSRNPKCDFEAINGQLFHKKCGSFLSQTVNFSKPRRPVQDFRACCEEFQKYACQLQRELRLTTANDSTNSVNHLVCDNDLDTKHHLALQMLSVQEAQVLDMTLQMMKSPMSQQQRRCTFGK